jgi:hypothetical protein
MSGNQPVDEPPEGVGFPAIGDYEIVPGPGEEGYVDPADETPPAADDPSDEGEAFADPNEAGDIGEDGPLDDGDDDDDRL